MLSANSTKDMEVLCLKVVKLVILNKLTRCCSLEKKSVLKI